MTIRYQCPECESVLKIKDELAGTDGKCPKCKTKFVVPEPVSDTPEKEKSTKKPTATEKPKKGASASKKTPAKKTSKKEAAKSATSKKSADDDFDPADFLMEDGPGPKASAGLSTPTEGKPKGPAVDSQGRRLYTGGGTSKARAASMSPAASAAASAADGQPATSANAGDLLAKSAEKARVHAASMPMEQKKPIFDFTGAGNELLRYAPHVIGSVLGIFLLYWGMGKMVGGGVELPKLGPVSGTVTVNGDPLVGVSVKFTPLDDARNDDREEGPKRIRTSSGVTDENGYYTLYYLDDIKGAALGKGRLWIEIRSAQDLKRVPPEWSTPGPNIREVRKTGNNNDGEFNIVINNGP